MLEDRLRDLKKAIDAKRAELPPLQKAADDAREKLAGAPIEAVQNPESEEFKAADEAIKPLSKASDELKVLEGQFERIALMDVDAAKAVGHKGLHEENDLDRDPAGAKQLALESLGAKVIGSDSYKELKERGAFADGSQKSVGSVALSDPLPRDQWIKSLRGAKSLLTGQDASGQAVIGPAERLPGIDVLPQLPLGIMDLITLGGTDAASVEFVRMVTRTVAAREVREAATSADITAGPPAVTELQAGLKPESGFTFEKVTEGVKTIAHTLPATRTELDDAEGLRTTVDGEMRTGVDRRAETQVIQGNGGDNIRGVLNTPGIAAYVQGTVVGENAADAIHRLFTMIRLAGFEPSALAAHPNDWQTVRLSKDTTGNYQFGPPSQAGGNQIWGVGVTQTIAVTEKAPVAAEWPRAEFRVREGVQVLVSDSHKDWFARNLLLLLAEARGVLVIRRPQAFGRLTLA